MKKMIAAVALSALALVYVHPQTLAQVRRPKQFYIKWTKTF